MNIQLIQRLNNEYRAKIYDAETIRLVENAPTKEEGLRYQQAAEICRQLSTLTTGAERERWISCQNACQRKMTEIGYALGMIGVRKEPADHAEEAGRESKRGADAREDGKKGGTSGKGETPDSPSKVPEGKWFRPDPGYGFDEVAGMDNIKKLLSDCVRDVSMEALNQYLGMPTVQSFFFYGPPGCGKTFIIEAFAHELMKEGYNYMSLESADIHSKFSGEADKIVKTAFQQAVDNAPCILFIDEVDGVCQNRSMPNLSDFNMQLTTTFLTCFNRLQNANKDRKSVVFIGATNYPANVDTAMLDRVELVQIPLPDEASRSFALQSKFGELVELEDGFTWEDMADATEGYNQRDLNRLSSKLKTLLRSAAAEGCSLGEDAVVRLQDGTVRITRELFETARQSYTPSPKDDIERQLNEFEEQMQTI